MALKILSWNIEHFDGIGGQATRGADRDAVIAARRGRLERIIGLLRQEDPDVFGLSEVEGREVHGRLTREMPGYVFNVTEGRQSQEILIGVRHGLTAFFTQRNEFKRSNPYLRPGALLTLTLNRDEDVPILFTHLKSGPNPEGFGLRDAMFEKIFNLRNSLNRAVRGAGRGAANFIVLGDMNTMGMDYDGTRNDIERTREVEVVTRRFGRRGMTRLSKTHGATFSNGSGSRLPDSDLDHVFAADHLVDRFQEIGNGHRVRVAGWAELPAGSRRDDWIRDFSDHAPLIFTLNL